MVCFGDNICVILYSYDDSLVIKGTFNVKTLLNLIEEDIIIESKYFRVAPVKPLFIIEL